eukprot:Nk52_evm25s370 gene=Nk52_evmTU25s370
MGFCWPSKSKEPEPDKNGIDEDNANQQNGDEDSNGEKESISSTSKLSNKEESETARKESGAKDKDSRKEEIKGSEKENGDTEAENDRSDKSQESQEGSVEGSLRGYNSIGSKGEGNADKEQKDLQGSEALANESKEDEPETFFRKVRNFFRRSSGKVANDSSKAAGNPDPVENWAKEESEEVTGESQFDKSSEEDLGKEGGGEEGNDMGEGIMSAPNILQADAQSICSGSNRNRVYTPEQLEYWKEKSIKLDQAIYMDIKRKNPEYLINDPLYYNNMIDSDNDPLNESFNSGKLSLHSKASGQSKIAKLFGQRKVDLNESIFGEKRTYDQIEPIIPDSDPKYSQISEFLRKNGSGKKFCKLFCGGKACKYENFDHRWVNQRVSRNAIAGLYSNWITPNIVASSRPSNTLIAMFDLVTKFKKLGISSIFNLQEPFEHPHCGYGIDKSYGFSYNPDVFMKNGIYFYNLQWKDYGIPTFENIVEIVQVLDFAVRDGGKALVHCHAGLGRTGLVIACYLIYKFHYTPSDAIKWVRLRRPNSVQTRQQINFVFQFEEFLWPLKCTFANAAPVYFPPFSLSEFLLRQRIFLHGEHSRGLRNCPVIIDVICNVIMRHVEGTQQDFILAENSKKYRSKLGDTLGDALPFDYEGLSKKKDSEKKKFKTNSHYYGVPLVSDKDYCSEPSFEGTFELNREWNDEDHVLANLNDSEEHLPEINSSKKKRQTNKLKMMIKADMHFAKSIRRADPSDDDDVSVSESEASLDHSAPKPTVKKANFAKTKATYMPPLSNNKRPHEETEKGRQVMRHAFENITAVWIQKRKERILSSLFQLNTGVYKILEIDPNPRMPVVLLFYWLEHLAQPIISFQLLQRIVNDRDNLMEAIEASEKSGTQKKRSKEKKRQQANTNEMKLMKVNATVLSYLPQEVSGTLKCLRRMLRKVYPKTIYNIAGKASSKNFAEYQKFYRTLESVSMSLTHLLPWKVNLCFLDETYKASLDDEQSEHLIQSLPRASKLKPSDSHKISTFTAWFKDFVFSSEEEWLRILSKLASLEVKDIGEQNEESTGGEEVDTEVTQKLKESLSLYTKYHKKGYAIDWAKMAGSVTSLKQLEDALTSKTSKKEDKRDSERLDNEERGSHTEDQATYRLEVQDMFSESIGYLPGMP